MVGRAYLVNQVLPVDVHAPANMAPIWPCGAKLRRPRAMIGWATGNSDRPDVGALERKNQITGRDLAHEFVEGITTTMSIALGRPKVSAFSLLRKGLVLINPPKTHFLLVNLRLDTQKPPSSRNFLQSAPIPHPTAKSSAMSFICSKAASKSSTISAAMTLGAGKFSESSSDASLSQKISRLALSRATSSS